jgi:hypothetical protein
VVRLEVGRDGLLARVVLLGDVLDGHGDELLLPAFVVGHDGQRARLLQVRVAVDRLRVEGRRQHGPDAVRVDVVADVRRDDVVHAQRHLRADVHGVAGPPVADDGELAVRQRRGRGPGLAERRRDQGALVRLRDGLLAIFEAADEAGELLDDGGAQRRRHLLVAPLEGDRRVLVEPREVDDVRELGRRLGLGLAVHGVEVEVPVRLRDGGELGRLGRLEGLELVERPLLVALVLLVAARPAPRLVDGLRAAPRLLQTPAPAPALQAPAAASALVGLGLRRRAFSPLLGLLLLGEVRARPRRALRLPPPAVRRVREVLDQRHGRRLLLLAQRLRELRGHDHVELLDAVVDGLLLLHEAHRVALDLGLLHVRVVRLELALEALDLPQRDLLGRRLDLLLLLFAQVLRVRQAVQVVPDELVRPVRRLDELVEIRPLEQRHLGPLGPGDLREHDGERLDLILLRLVVVAGRLGDALLERRLVEEVVVGRRELGGDHIGPARQPLQGLPHNHYTTMPSAAATDFIVHCAAGLAQS